MPETQKAAIVRYGLGGLWLLDGILQFQPLMFTHAFVDQVLTPVLGGQPAWIIALLTFGIHLWSANLLASNLGAAILQTAIGLLLLLPFNDHIRRFGLWLSALWGVAVWIFGEGFGALATGSATFYAGAPGSALIYVLLAAALLYYSRPGREPNFSASLSRLAGLIFLIGAALNLLPMFWQPTMLSMLSMGAPAPLSAWLSSLGAQGTSFGNLIAVNALVIIGAFLLLLPKNRAVAWTAVAFLALVWWIGQGFGGLQAFPFGLATDPNTAPALALALLPALL